MPRSEHSPPSIIQRVARGRSTPVLVALVVLFAVSPLLASGSLSRAAVLSMLPFAAVLVLASIGQSFVVQQGGLDFSVPGSISLATVIVTHHAASQSSRLVVAVLLVLLATTAAGALNGLLVAVARVPPIIATLGVGALLTGAAATIAKQSVVPATAGLTRFMGDRTLGVPNTFLIAVLAVAVVAAAVRWTGTGRRFQFAGMSPAAARVAGLPVTTLSIAGYAAAGAAYGIAGIVLAGYVSNPDLNAGDPYLLSTVAAVVLGGASLAGGRASTIATAAGAVFLSQLDQVALSSGADVWAQYVIQGAVIGLGISLRQVRTNVGRGWLDRLRRDTDVHSAAAPVAVANSTTLIGSVGDTEGKGDNHG